MGHMKELINDIMEAVKERVDKGHALDATFLVVASELDVDPQMVADCWYEWEMRWF